MREEEEEFESEARIIHVSRGEVRPRLNHESCGICGRTILVGETPELYSAPEIEAEALIVCSVCRPHARVAGFSKVA